MSLIMKSEFENPDETPVIAVGCDLWIQKPNDPSWGLRVKYGFLLGGKRRNDGQPFYITADFPWKFSPGSDNRKFVEDWNGRGFSFQEAQKGLPESWFIGRLALITPVLTPTKSGGVWPDVEKIRPCPQGREAEAPSLSGYVRMQDRDEKDLPKYLQGGVLVREQEDPRVAEAQKLLNASETDQVPF